MRGNPNAWTPVLAPIRDKCRGHIDVGILPRWGCLQMHNPTSVPAESPGIA